jgi:hypothetical protein
MWLLTMKFSNLILNRLLVYFTFAASYAYLFNLYDTPNLRRRVDLQSVKLASLYVIVSLFK